MLSGAILEFGLGDKFKAFDEVQRSNMSKACSSEEEAKLPRPIALIAMAPVHHYPKGDQWMVIDKGIIKC